MRNVRHWWHLGLAGAALLAGVCTSRPILAEVTGDASRMLARTLGEEGLDAMDRGDLPTAWDRLNRAYQLHPVPSLALWSGRILAKMGRLVAASERWREAEHLDIAGGDEQVQRQAQRDAAEARKALLPKIASLTLTVKPRIPDGSRLLIDGSKVPIAVVGTAMPIDPGSHEIAWLWLDNTIKRRVTLAEGASENIELVVTDEPPNQASAADGQVPSLAKGFDTNPPPDVQRGSLQSTLGWVSLGLGAAGLATWGITGLVTINRKNQLEQRCPDGRCSPEYQSDLDSFRTIRTASAIGFFAGIAAAGAGTLLVVTAPRKTKGAGNVSRWHAWIGASSVGLAGTY